jgi:peptidoglycan/LPS O-acetylase OafA/YrhL
MDAAPADKSSATIARRPALDGLRAIAVLLVFGFHAKVPGLSGGFLGVDLFFVLSGYLITSLLILEGEASQTIALGAFWARRVRRLMPAFFVLAFAVVVHGVLRAPEFLREKLRTDVIASLLYVANWRFIDSSSYFASDGTVSSLQHVWSLAIEEQFYAVWPLAVLLTLRFGSKPLQPGRVGRRIAWLATIGGLASAVWLGLCFSPLRPERAYMGTDTRAFEPLFGALLACAFQSPAVRAWCGRFRLALSALGTLGLALGVMRLGVAGDVAPGYFRGGALGFTLATCALIAGIESGSSVWTRSLSWWPAEKLGVVSYGFYLWHWPIIAWSAGENTQFGWGRTATTLLATLVACTLSYVLVERPTRFGAFGRRLTTRRLAWITPSLIMLVSGTAVWALKAPPKSGFTVFLVGDSVPKQLMPYVSMEAKRRGWQVFHGAEGDCSVFPVIPVSVEGTPYGTEICKTLVPQLHHDGLVLHRPDVVVWWSRYDTTHRLSASGEVLRAGTPAFWADQRLALRATVDRLTEGGAHLVMIEQDRPGRGMYNRCTPSECPWFLRDLLERYDLAERWNEMIRELALSDRRVTALSLDSVYCHDTNVPCDDKLGDTWARPDGTHFSAEGGALVSRALLDKLAKYRSP